MVKKNYWAESKKQIKNNKGTFFVYVVLRFLVICAMVISCFRGNYENLFFCALALVLFLVPSFIENNFKIELPQTLEIIILLFIFASVILGEMGSYYTKIPYWDTLLHTVNGFLCAAIGFAMTDVLNRNENIKFKLSPIFLAIVAFCFSMTIGVLWEFFEFFCDIFLKTDMQKDTMINSISSVMLSTGIQKPVRVDGITNVAINGKELGLGGYIDIGLYDTMKDLFVNFVGAMVFCIIGYFYVKTRGKKSVVTQFIPTIKKEKETE